MERSLGECDNFHLICFYIEKRHCNKNIVQFFTIKLSEITDFYFFSLACAPDITSLSLS